MNKLYKSDVIKSNSISIKNSSNEVLTIIVEYIFFSEDLPPNKTFKMSVSANVDINISNFFNIDYQPNQVTIFLNNEAMNAYDIEFFVDNVSIAEQRL